MLGRTTAREPRELQLTRFAAGWQDNIGLAKSTGLFSAPPPLCVTEPYKGPDRIAPRFKGKQIATGYLKHDKSAFAPGTFNAPLLLWSESKDQFKDGTHYKDVFPPDKKKNGFGSSDFPKRDEYSDTKKTCQLRETLKKEGKKEREARDATDVRVVDYQTRMPG
ncbi:hypothetical protein T484DRAFT_2616211 [Baffinella frigidus]|nr:hypothetical protein T484DRAFT_2616211 [Cryptophyta sp. CCMP2293]